MRTAIVTGAAKGLGASIARHLSKNNWRVVIHYKNSERDANLLLDEIIKNSPESFLVQADLRSETDIDEMFKKIKDKADTVDLLINNVGNFVFKKFGETTNNEFRDVVESNIYSTLFVSRAALFVMRKQKSGQIINIGAVGAERLIIRENSTPYFLGKTGIYVLTKTMAWEEAKLGIRINMISPGSMEADIFNEKDFPMGRPAKHEDVISAIDFLTSDSAYYINGANIEVSGGFVPGMDKAE